VRTDHVERITGKKPVSLREIFLRHKDTWPK
jgi:hypothetical protein